MEPRTCANERCLICFIPRDPRQLYCQERCRLAAARRRHYHRYPEKCKARVRIWSGANKALIARKEKRRRLIRQGVLS